MTRWKHNYTVNYSKKLWTGRKKARKRSFFSLSFFLRFLGLSWPPSFLLSLAFSSLLSRVSPSFYFFFVQPSYLCTVLYTVVADVCTYVHTMNVWVGRGGSKLRDLFPLFPLRLWLFPPPPPPFFPFLPSSSSSTPVCLVKEAKMGERKKQKWLIFKMLPSQSMNLQEPNWNYSNRQQSTQHRNMFNSWHFRAKI